MQTSQTDCAVIRQWDLIYLICLNDLAQNWSFTVIDVTAAQTLQYVYVLTIKEKILLRPEVKCEFIM